MACAASGCKIYCIQENMRALHYLQVYVSKLGNARRNVLLFLAVFCQSMENILFLQVQTVTLRN